MAKRTARGLLVDNRDTIREVARELHITPEVLGRKLDGKSEFKAREIKALILRYDLTPDETFEIFFDLEPKST